jgi:hypothetical protein
MDKMIVGLIITRSVQYIAHRREGHGWYQSLLLVTVDVQDDVQDDSNPVVHDDDSEDESGDEDDKLVEFSAREASTYPSRPQQVDRGPTSNWMELCRKKSWNASVRIQFQTHHLVVGR